MNRTLKNFSNSSENLDSQLRNCLLDPVGKIQIYFRCFYSTLIIKQVHHKVIFPWASLWCFDYAYFTIAYIWDGRQISYTFYKFWLYRIKYSKRQTDKAKILISICPLHPFDEFLFDRPIISGEFGDLSRLDRGISLLKCFKYPS